MTGQKQAVPERCPQCGSHGKMVDLDDALPNDDTWQCVNSTCRVTTFVGER